MSVPASYAAGNPAADETSETGRVPLPEAFIADWGQRADIACFGQHVLVHFAPAMSGALWVAIWALVGAVLILARPALVAAAGAWSAWKERPDPIVPSDDEFAAIVRAVIEANESGYGLPPAPPPPAMQGDSPRPAEKVKPVELIFEDRSLTLCSDERPPPTDECRPDFGTALLHMGVSRKWNAEFVLANRASVSVPDPGMPAVHRTSQAAVRHIFEVGSWNEFYARFPGTAGILKVSVPVLSADHSQALIYAEQFCEMMCATGWVHLMQRTPQGWREVRKLGVMQA